MGALKVTGVVQHHPRYIETFTGNDDARGNFLANSARRESGGGMVAGKGRNLRPRAVDRCEQGQTRSYEPGGERSAAHQVKEEIAAKKPSHELRLRSAGGAPTPGITYSTRSQKRYGAKRKPARVKAHHKVS